MKLYEIDEAITALIDEETGEITDFEAFENLQMEREAKIENLALWYKDLKAEAEAIRTEEKALADRRKRTENKAESVKRFLDTILAGNPFKTSKVDVNYRKSTAVRVDEDFVNWAVSNDRDDLLKFSEPTPALTEIKNAIKNNDTILFATLEEKKSINIK